MRRISVFLMVLMGAALLIPAEASALPAWARKYNMNCSGCHSPAVPRLNAKGMKFKWAGYRMPEEIGENSEISNVSEVLATRERFRYVYSKTEGDPASANEFQFSDASVFLTAALGKNYGTFVELEHAVGETEIGATMTGAWGNEKRFGGFRAGQIHWLLRGAVAGFDRPTGISTPTPLGKANTMGAPFKFSTDQLGVEAFYVAGRNRMSVEVLNGLDAAGKGDEGGSPTSKDFVLTNQFMYDDAGSGFTAVGYFGTVDGLDPLVGGASHYTRIAISANKIFSNSFEVLGGYVQSNDKDLPVGTVFSSSSMSGSGYWVYGGYTFPGNSQTLFGRYEFNDTNKDVANSGSTRAMLGSVIPVNLPEYLRLAAEFTLDTPRASGAKKTTGFVFELMFNF